MNAIPYDSREEDWDRYGDADYDDELPGRPRRNYFNRWSALLFAVLLGGIGFYAGVRVEKGQLAGSSGSAAASRFASLLSSAGTSSSTSGRAGSRNGTPPGGGSFTGRGGGDFAGAGGIAGFASAFAGGNAAIGTVSSVNGDTIYVQETSGNTVKVKLSKATKITKSVKVTKAHVYPGDSVVASGIKGSGGGLTATSITDSGARSAATGASGTGGSGTGGSGGGSGGAAGALRSLFGGGGGG